MFNSTFVNGIEISMDKSNNITVTTSIGHISSPVYIYPYLYGSAIVTVKIAPPLNVACPKCNAIIGMKCKNKQVHAKP